MELTKNHRFAGVLQLLYALAFLIAPVAGLVYGADVQAAAEAELIRQGLSPSVLAENNVHFDEGGYALLVPVGTAVVVAVLGALNLAGRRAGWILTLIAQPLFLVMDVLVILSQLSKVEYLQNILGTGADARAVVNATSDAYPDWVFVLTEGRMFFTPVAAVAVIVLLLLPSTRAYFRR
ncbi:hypothetical protein AB0K48_18175 [Nonomuraea sp. NPDC055795]